MSLLSWTVKFNTCEFKKCRWSWNFVPTKLNTVKVAEFCHGVTELFSGFGVSPNKKHCGEASCCIVSGCTLSAPYHYLQLFDRWVCVMVFLLIDVILNIQPIRITSWFLLKVNQPYSMLFWDFILFLVLVVIRWTP